MSKKPFARLLRIVTGTFGSARDDALITENSLTRLERFAHYWVLVWQSFVRNRCFVRASALSFTTLLALIPMLTVAMSVSSILLKTATSEEQIKTFVEQFIEHMVPGGATDDRKREQVEGAADVSTNQTAVPVVLADTNTSPESLQTNLPVVAASVTNAPAASDNSRIALAKKEAASYIYTFIHNSYGGRLGVIGAIFLLWTTIATLTRVEETFNDIWGITRGRDWWSRIANYLIATLIGPLLIFGALGLTGGTYFQKSRQMIGVVPYLEPLVSQLLPILIICITFAFFYKLMPNTKVNFGAAFVGGALAGTAWHFFNVASIHLATRAVTASKIYGSLALVPLLMMGLYTVWVIVLFGAQVAYAFQNRASYLQERLAENVNQRGREFVALRLMTCIGRRFAQGLPPPTVQEISRELGIPSKLVQQVLQTLIAARLVIEVAGIEHAYSPARPLEAINAHHVLIAMRATHGQDFITLDEPVRAEIYGEFARIQAAEEQAASAVTMLSLVNRAHGRLTAPSPAQANAPAQIAPAVVEFVNMEDKSTIQPPGAPASEPVQVKEVVQRTELKTENSVPEPTAQKVEVVQSISPERPTASSATNEEESFPL